MNLWTSFLYFTPMCVWSQNHSFKTGAQTVYVEVIFCASECLLNLTLICIIPSSAGAKHLVCGSCKWALPSVSLVLGNAQNADVYCLPSLVSKACRAESKPKVLLLSRLLYSQVEGGIKELIIFNLLHLTNWFNWKYFYSHKEICFISRYIAW